MADPALVRLQHERRALHHRCLVLCEAFAYAHVAQSPAAADLKETLHARYVELAALDMLMASYDPQMALFDDYYEVPLC